MLKQPFIAALLATAIAVGSAQAATTPHAGGADPRVKYVNYHERDVTTVAANYGYSTVIEFGKDETIKNIGIGDSEAWLIEPVGNLLFVKPLEPNPHTNMTVVTNKRLYDFDLDAKDSHGSRNNLTYRIQFQYPAERMAELANIGQGSMAGTKLVSGSASPADWNFGYTYSGDKNLRPKQAFDDGNFTYFHFADNARTPAIFVVDDRGNESLVNYHKEGDYIVVERLGRRFTLRDGEDVTCIFNESFPVVEHTNEPLAPRASTVVEPVSIKEAGDVMVQEEAAPAPQLKEEGDGWFSITGATKAKKENQKRNAVKR